MGMGMGMGMGIGMHSFFQEGMKNGNAFYFLGGMKIQTIFWVYFLNFFGDEKNGKKNHSFSQGMGMGMHSFFQMGMKNGNECIPFFQAGMGMHS